MPRLIDANAIPYELCYVPEGDVQWEYRKAYIAEMAVIDAMPTVDAVEVVRCKDCWKWYPYNGGGSHDCPFCGYPEGDDFCSYGERREGE